MPPCLRKPRSVSSWVLGLLIGVSASSPAAVSTTAGSSVEVPDLRHLTNGRVIPSEGYADQPYMVRTDDGAWLCILTTGPGAEGATGQHVVSRRSSDQGRSWSDAVPLEPGDGPESSYAVMLKASTGRVYAFYNFNTENQREVRREDGGVFRRVDSLGDYAFRYSDDHGRSWSDRRYVVPVREFASDRENVYGGKVRFFWNVGRPLVVGSTAWLTLHKVGAMGEGFFAQSEGAFLRSTNLLTEPDPDRIAFETLPRGDLGLRTPPGGGRVAEEQSVVALSDGSLFCIYRTRDGWPACAYSRDGGETWTPPVYATDAPGGRRIKHPRAANFVWRCDNGRYLYWYHFHGGSPARNRPDWDPYADRNPAWLAAGEELDSPEGKVLRWSQPEIVLYDDDPFIRMSYPDLVEEDGAFYVTETQKDVARVHRIPDELLRGLFGQATNAVVSTNGLALRLSGPMAPGAPVAMPRLPEFHRADARHLDHRGLDLRTGFSLDLWLSFDDLRDDQVILDGRDAWGRGLCLRMDSGSLVLTLGDGRTVAEWRGDEGRLSAGRLHHVVVTVDGGPKIITFVIDGVLCDGGETRQFGWGRFSPHLRSANGAAEMRVAPRMNGSVSSLRVYRRALTTSEAVAHWRAGMTGTPGVVSDES